MSEKVTRRRFLKGLAVAAGSSVLAACAPKVVKETVIVEKPVEKVVKETVIIEGTPKVVEKVVTVAPPAKEAPTELRLSHWWGDQHKQWLPVVEEKANVKISEEIYPWGEYIPKLQTQIAGGVAPDIIQLDQGHNGYFFPKGILVPFDDALAASGIDMSKWDVDPAVEVGYKGKIMALSLFTMQGRMVYLNMDLVKKAGYPVDELPTWGTPRFDMWHWDDYVEFMKAVTIKKSDGTFDQYGIDSTPTDATSFTYQLASYGADMIDDPWSYEETKALLDQPDAIAAAHDLLDLCLVHEVSPTIEAAQGIEGGMFAAGMACSNINWTNQTWLLREFPFELGYMHLPFTKLRVHGVGANHWTVYKESKEIAKAQEACIVQTTDYEVGQRLLDLAATMPSYDPVHYLSSLPEGDLGVITRINLSRLKGMSECAYCTEDVNMFNRAGFGRTAGFLQDTFIAEMEKALIGEKSVEQAMADANAAITAEIQDTPL